MLTKERLRAILELLPPRISVLLENTGDEIIRRVDEIRLRAQRPIAFTMAQGDVFLSRDGGFQSLPKDAVIIEAQELRETFLGLCRHSIYAYEEELRSGYLTLPGGNRVGVGGRTVVRGGEITSMAECSSLCIRIAREVKGCGDFALAYLHDGTDVHSSLIISPPMMGKTTMLRDIARQVSDGIFGAGGKRVCVVDERCEIASCHQGVPQMDVGQRTDVLDGCPKSQGMTMALRSLSPQVIVTDELGGAADSAAVMNALFSGVKVIASAHGTDIDDVLRRSDIRALVEQGAFSRYFILGDRPGTVKEVLNESLNLIYSKDAYR
ncbi:MAG: stage III sporulation protein AA [Bacillota bacterium]|nr:MAG: stage III sporulation protein AA [Bacillota bacterium]